jgi:hypothetical protein
MDYSEVLGHANFYAAIFLSKPHPALARDDVKDYMLGIPQLIYTSSSDRLTLPLLSQP